jgi:hypothetical protein
VPPPLEELSPFTAPIPQVRESAPVPPAEPPPAVFEPPPPDLDDVPTAPFEFPIHLYRVGSVPEPPAEPTAPEPPATPPPVFAPEPADVPPPAAAATEPPPPPEPEPPPPPPAAEPPLVSATLAQLYETQGYAADARETYETLAASEPDGARASELRERATRLPAGERTDHPHLRRLARRFPLREEATANDIHAIIRALVESTEGIRAATLTDLEGLPVVTAGPGARDPGQEILVAELTSFLKGVGRAAGEVGAGALSGLTFLPRQRGLLAHPARRSGRGPRRSTLGSRSRRARPEPRGALSAERGNRRPR